MTVRLRIDGTTFRDAKNRQVILHGINAGGDAKFPRHPDLPSHEPANFFDGDNVSFVGRPFSVEDAPTHFRRLKQWGYNTIRYVFTWEAIEHAGPGKYDEEWIQYTIKVLRVAKSFGFYVFMDPHQDIWSRFTGGSGAPMWTLYACGLDPKKFIQTEAALVQNTWPEGPEEFPKMIWATNYYRLACQVTFTLFFAGKLFAPLAVIDGVNIEEYLQNHFIAACKHFMMRVSEARDIDGDVIIGWESLNEPNRGLIGVQDLSVVPAEQKLQLGTSPNAWQAMLLGSGRPCEVETWAFGSLGPYKSGSTVVDPQGQIAWLSSDYDDSRYGWKRDSKWQLGQCLWAQHGVWDPDSDTLLRSDYFAKDPSTGESIDYEYFTNHFFMELYRKHARAVRDVFPETLMFCQPPTLELPPSIKGTDDDDPNMVYAPHWYDGVTLMSKKWNRIWNVDVFGVLRGRYLTPAFAIKIGQTAIRNCFRNTMLAMQKEGLDYMGEHPFLLGEFGIPYDMDDQHAYETGDYTSQTLAMDANRFAVEGSISNFTLWNFTASNTHQWGDQWNGEDLSIFSLDDELLPSNALARADSSFSFDRNSPSYSESHTTDDPSASSVGLKKGMTTSTVPVGNANEDGKGSFRAAEAYVRPYPIAVHGNLSSYGFDLKKCEFNIAISAADSTKDDGPTEIFLPEYHFPKESIEVEVSGGKWTLTKDEDDVAPTQTLLWWHSGGDQTLRVQGLVKRAGMCVGAEEDDSYLARCREELCRWM